MSTTTTIRLKLSIIYTPGTLIFEGLTRQQLKKEAEKEEIIKFISIFLEKHTSCFISAAA